VTDIAVQIMAEIDRARRLQFALNNAQDRLKIEHYIAELDARAARSGAKRSQA